MPTLVFEIVGLIASIIGICLAVYLSVGFIRYIHRKNALQEYEINLAYDTKDIEAELDTMIQDAITMYNVLNLAYDDNIYITDKMEEEIRKSVTEDLDTRLTKSYLDRLSLVYKPDKISEVIATKIYIAVMLFKVQNNSGKTATPNV